MEKYMNQNICYNCGGEFIEKGGNFICCYCGTKKLKNVSNEEINLLCNAYQKLRLSDFSEAEQQFDDIIRRYPHNAQGYWGRLLAKYGIKYEDDYDGTKIPTCYATSLESFFDASDYKKALGYADEETKIIFEKHAGYIERVRKEWINKASAQKSYDIFISYKESDLGKNIERTQDSYDMQELYFLLKEKGYRVFYSRESLRNIAGEKYEPYIYSALSSAKVMILYGSNPEYIRSPWVKNEWTRYIKRMREGQKRSDSLLVVYKDFSPIELPGILSSIQLFNANKLTFLIDLCKKVDQIICETINADENDRFYAPNVISKDRDHAQILKSDDANNFKDVNSAVPILTIPITGGIVPAMLILTKKTLTYQTNRKTKVFPIESIVSATCSMAWLQIVTKNPTKTINWATGSFANAKLMEKELQRVLSEKNFKH